MGFPESSRLCGQLLVPEVPRWLLQVDLGGDIEVDISGLLQLEFTLDKAGDKLWEMMIRVCNGRLTRTRVWDTGNWS